MRDIRFRVWSPKYKTMQDNPFALCSGYCMENGALREADGPYGEEYSNETDDILMEWTGLVDMDGEDVYEGDILASRNAYHTSSRSDDPVINKQTVFFTDRSLYRPGQNIHYKGICILTDTVRNNYQTLAGQQLTVVNQPLSEGISNHPALTQPLLTEHLDIIAT